MKRVHVAAAVIRGANGRVLLARRPEDKHQGGLWEFPGGKVEVEFTKQYLNMRQKLDQTPQVTELLFKAAELAGAKPYSKPIRGGTDGARLTEMGIPTPNLFAGMHNFHGRHEWASAAEMVQATDTILKLMELWTQT
ncbi:MAG TPA: hypothetical protein DCX65_04305 [Spirochaetaceae bacterium]|nr:hypothetical protein [Spirochaetaceae bacterium]